MPTPKEVFDDPAKFWNFLTSPNDDDIEGQFFDRKEFDGAKFHLQVQKTISAFANSNLTGGLLILGISSTGKVKGIEHFDGVKNKFWNKFKWFIDEP